jgi:hypothetical protein
MSRCFVTEEPNKLVLELLICIRGFGLEPPVDRLVADMTTRPAALARLAAVSYSSGGPDAETRVAGARPRLTTLPPSVHPPKMDLCSA